MARSKHHKARQNEAIRTRYKVLRRTHPQWMVTAIISQLSLEFYLEEVTIGKILYATDTDVPSPATIARRVSTHSTP